MEKSEDGFDPNQYNEQTQTLPNTDNETMNLKACTDLKNYEKATSKDKTFSFIYPTTIFNDSSADDMNNEYSLIISDGENNYIMEIEFEDSDYKDSYKEINYVIDCMYRGCSFTNSSYKVRTYKQFKNDEMGEKK